jgi:RNA-directed DNA polymerase
VSEPKPKSFDISKRAVWEAWLRVKANGGVAGVDEQSITEFESDLQGNLYKLWNRLSSGSYMPPPVRAVEIPKRDGSPRMLGVPTVADRIAQTVVRGYLEPGVEPFFTSTPMGIGRVGRRWTRSGSAGSAAGSWTGCSIWTPGPSLTASRTT